MSSSSVEKKLDQNTQSSVTDLVPPVEFAFVHLNKPIDLAMVAQVALATDNLRLHMVGNSLDFDHPKIKAKLKSWNIEKPDEKLGKTARSYEDIADLRDKNQDARLIGTIVEGGHNPFKFDWQDNDIIVIGGANGLSKFDVEKMDRVVTIPTHEQVDFLTVSVVVSSLTYHILNYRGLWDKDEFDQSEKS